MKKYERESFRKSFLIFLILLEVLVAINFWNEYQVKKVEIEDKIHIEMKLCAFTLQCEGLKTDFVDKDEDKDIEEIMARPELGRPTLVKDNKKEVV